ncbi:MAG: hypothetical protein G01um10148_261 [Parcubacteria group bacterium Gr01-1014_8]|nr:MAG: hypothetical protein G01um10148_261 [Parcubacteria group bacterium Gr01-1014_8]
MLLTFSARRGFFYMKKMYLSAGILVAMIVTVLTAFGAGSTTYTIYSPKSDSNALGSTSDTRNIPNPATTTISTYEVDMAETSSSKVRPTSTPEKIETATTVADPQHDQTSYTFAAKESGTVLAAMEEFAKKSHFEFKTKEFPGLGVMVEEINGLRSDNGYYWILYVNGKTANTGASTAKVSSGDSIEWRYKKGY